MTNKKLIVCIVLLSAGIICLLFVNHSFKKENEYLTAEIEGVFRKADKNEYFLNDGLYYMNGDADKCFFKITEGYIQFILEDKERFRDLYKLEITDKYTPDNTNYKEFDEWFEHEADYWKYPRKYELVYNTVLNPEEIAIGYDFGFSENMSVGSFLSTADYIDHNSIKYIGSGGPLSFTKID